MKTTTALDLLPGRILVVDDERQIHASLKLRLGKDYTLVCHSDPRQALTLIAEERFDLCIVDIHMPHIDGLAFVEAAQKTDPALGYVILSAFDSGENLRRTIPLHVYDFISKPLPERHRLEARIPEWIEATRRRRDGNELTRHASTLASERELARIERDVELVASETARDALLQTANLLTTVHAHLVNACLLVAPRGRTDPATGHLARNLEEARKTADAAMAVAGGFFDSAYGNRDSSPAMINEGVHHAIGIVARSNRIETDGKVLDFTPLDDRAPVRGLSGIDFLLMMVPVLGLALASAPANTTVGIGGEHHTRLDNVLKDPRFRGRLWLNRKNALTSHPAVVLLVTAAGSPLQRGQIEAWLKGDYAPLASLTPRGLIAGVQKAQGLIGIALAPEVERFQIVLALPV